MFDGLTALARASKDDSVGLSESSVTGTRLDLSEEISLARIEVVCVWFTLSRVSITGIYGAVQGLHTACALCSSP